MRVEISEDLEDLIPKFMKNRERDILYIKDYLFQKRYSEVGNIVHALKGVLGSYGFDDFYKDTVKIERDLKDEKYDILLNQVEKLGNELKEVEIIYIEEEF